MSKIIKEEKQSSIENIKELNRMSADGVVPSLFREVKLAKQQAINLSMSIRERILALQHQEEERVKLEALRNQAKMKSESQNQKPEESESFAQLFLQGKEKPTKSPAENSQTSSQQQPQKQEPAKQEPPVAKQPEQKVENKQEPKKPEQNTNVQRQNSFQPRQSGTSRPQGNGTPRPFNNYNNFNRQPQRPFNNYNNGGRPFNNYNNNGGQRPFNNYQNRNSGFNSNQNRTGSFQNFGQKRPFGANNSGTTRPQFANRGIAGIIPRKTNTLTSASSVFASKERDFTNKKKSSYRGSSDDDRRINKKSLLRRGLVEEQNIEERMFTRKLRLKKPKTEQAVVVSAPITDAVITTPNLTVKILSEKIGKPVTEIIKELMVLGIMTTINSPIDFPTAELVSNELGVKLELKLQKTFEEKLKEKSKFDDGTNRERRAPIVTIVGHVDHGKTSLLDYIRKTHVTKDEAGGITQKIGAYSINWKGENITFVDTPGHEAFINMRKRGTEITDVAILIVAGDDGVKPQTIEAIKEIKEAKVPMIVAITKIDKPDVDVERVKQQLTDYEVLPEEWGGDVIVVPVSSVTGKGIDKLLETILLVAEMQELKCNTKRKAVGTIIEATLDKNRGPIANIIVQNGTLHIGDNIVSGFALGKVRALIDDKGRLVAKAGPSTPVSVLGLDNVPNAGDSLQVVDEKFSKNVIEERKIKMAEEKIENGAAKSLDEFLATPAQEDKKAFSIIIKADNQGSAEALQQSLSEIKNDEVNVEVIACGVGNINENDIRLASVSNATIISFNTKVLSKILNFAKQNKVEIKEYDIIYKAIEDTQEIIKNMMAPKFEEHETGKAEVRALFKISSLGTIAGCYVTEGKIVRNGLVKVLRGETTVFEGKIATLKREKNDAKEVASGFECGIKIDNFNDIQEGDIIVCTVKEQIKN